MTDKITIEISIPYDQPDKNGFVYTKDCVEKCIKNGFGMLPIFDSKKIIGNTCEEQAEAEWDDDKKICKIKINGIIYDSEISYTVNKRCGKTIEDFTICEIGVTAH